MASKVVFVDNPQAPDVFADACSGVWFNAGLLRLTFEAGRMSQDEQPGTISRVVIGRLILPLAAAESLRDLLIDYIPKVKGIAGNSPAPGQTIQ